MELGCRSEAFFDRRFAPRRFRVSLRMRSAAEASDTKSTVAMRRMPVRVRMSGMIPLYVALLATIESCPTTCDP